MFLHDDLSTQPRRPHTHALGLLAALFIALWVAPVAAQTAQATHPIVGTWSWTLFGGKCQETWLFRPDGTLLTTSGEAVTGWNYTITPQASEARFYRLVLVPTRQNGKKDCSGDTVQEDSPETRSYIQMSPAKDRFISCKAESLAACFGPLGRVQ